MRARAPLVVLLLGAVASSAFGADARRKPDEDRGKQLYERHCAACHGVRAGGDGPATAALVVPVPDLQGSVKADKATIDLVLLGRGPMPSFEASFQSDDAKKVLAYMAKLTTVTPPTPGEGPEAEVPVPSDGEPAPEVADEP